MSRTSAETQTFLSLGFTKQNSHKQDPGSPTIPAPWSETRWPKRVPDVGLWIESVRRRRTRAGFRQSPISKEIRGWYAFSIFRSWQMEVCPLVMRPGTWWVLWGSCRLSGSAEHGVTQFQVENVQAVIHSWPFAPDQLGLRREAAIWNLDFSCSDVRKAARQAGYACQYLTLRMWH